MNATLREPQLLSPQDAVRNLRAAAARARLYAKRARAADNEPTAQHFDRMAEDLDRRAGLLS